MQVERTKRNYVWRCQRIDVGDAIESGNADKCLHEWWREERAEKRRQSCDGNLVTRD